MIHIWRLNEAGPNNLGLACVDDGLLLGKTPLIERRDGRFVVRAPVEIERLLKRAYREDSVVDRLMPGLATVAAALNANDPCLARIAAVHLRIPDLPDTAARDGMEAEDILIKCARFEEPAGEKASEIEKASADDPKRPGWPAGTPGGRGGKFRPKRESELTQQVKSRIARRGLRIGLLAVLRVGLEGVANLIPGVDVAADLLMIADIALTVSEFRKLAIDATAALEFAKQGPRSFEELQVPTNEYEEFSSYYEFVKGELILDVMAKRFGRAGDGNQYHHIVTQGGANEGKIPPEKLQNTDNVIILPTILHEAVNAEYSRKSPVENMNMYQWLQTQPYDVQHEVGLKILRELHILK
jgi:hypothetical protein